MRRLLTLALAMLAGIAASVSEARADIAASSLTIQPMFTPAEPIERGKWKFTLGLGALVVPDYIGSDDYTFAPVPVARATYDNYFVEVRGLALRANVLNNKWFHMGPVIRGDLGRDDVNNRRVDDLPDVDPSAEIGAFARLQAKGWFLGLEAAQDVASGHGGLLVTWGAGKRFQLAERMGLTIAGGMTWADKNYMDSNFSVGRLETRSGLKMFQAGNSLRDASASITYTWGFAPNWGLGVILSYARLSGDAADSPVTDDEGSANQLVGGAIVSYTF